MLCASASHQSRSHIVTESTLHACSVIILASDYAAILAHIGPNELGSQDLQSFLGLANNKMSELEEIYRKN